MSTPLVGLQCGDDPAAWRGLGFAVEDGVCVLGPVAIALDGGGGGLRGWELGGRGGPGALDGIATTWRDGDRAAGREPHPNGTDGLDHVVVFTGSRDRTVAALVQAGGDLRRSAGPPQLPAPMAFVRMGDVIVEVAESGSPRGTHLWGLVAVVPDLEDLVARYPDALGSPRDAVQPGRRIVTARRRDGLECALAFMTPR